MNDNKEKIRRLLVRIELLLNPSFYRNPDEIIKTIEQIGREPKTERKELGILPLWGYNKEEYISRLRIEAEECKELNPNEIEEAKRLLMALDGCNDVLKLDPKNVQALFYKIQIFRKQNKKDEEIKTYDKLLSILSKNGGDTPKPDDFFSDSLEILSNLQNYEEYNMAIEWCNYLVEEFGNIAAPFFSIRGYIKIGKDHIKEGIKDYLEAIKLSARENEGLEDDISNDVIKIVELLEQRAIKTEKEKEELQNKLKKIKYLNDEERLKFYNDISSFESELRQFVKKILEENKGKNWIKVIPRDITERAERKKQNDTNEGVEPEKELINYFDFLDNHTIILKYWKLFEKYLKVREYFSTRLKDIYNVGRNPLMHSRPIPKPRFYITDHAIKWIRTRIKEIG